MVFLHYVQGFVAKARKHVGERAAIFAGPGFDHRRRLIANAFMPPDDRAVKQEAGRGGATHGGCFPDARLTDAEMLFGVSERRFDRVLSKKPNEVSKHKLSKQSWPDAFKSEPISKARTNPS